MKKQILLLTMILAMGVACFAQEGGGLFGRGVDSDANSYNYRETGDGSLISLPDSHGGTSDQEATPLGGGIAVLTTLGAAYLIGKKRKED